MNCNIQTYIYIIIDFISKEMLWICLTIGAKCREDPENYLQECLTRWLSKADIVTNSGGPTWDSLASGLEKIREVSAAEKIKELSKQICIIVCM